MITAFLRFLVFLGVLAYHDFQLFVSHFLARVAQIGISTKLVLPVFDIWRRYEQTGVRRVSNRSAVSIPQRTGTHSSKGQPERRYNGKMLPTTEPASKLALHVPLCGLGPQLQQVTITLVVGELRSLAFFASPFLCNVDKN